MRARGVSRSDAKKSLSINVAHLNTLGSPIVSGVLDDAKTVNPDESQAQIYDRRDGILEGLWQSGHWYAAFVLFDVLGRGR